MKPQSQFWSQAAENYERDFIDPYRDDAKNPLLPTLKELARTGAKTVADLGCGTGPLLSQLARTFDTVYAVDFAEGMLQRARKRCPKRTNISFLQQPLTDLQNLKDKLDVAVASNSLVMPNVADQEKCLEQIIAALRPGGTFLAILPAMDSVHYCTMLLMDRALAAGKPLDSARRSAAYFGEHQYYDFAFGQFHYMNLEQHFWQPFEITYRFGKAGFLSLTCEQVTLPWDQFVCGDELKDQPPPWDWFVRAEKPK